MTAKHACLLLLALIALISAPCSAEIAGADPAPSPDGTHMAFTDHGRLMVGSVAGGAARALPTGVAVSHPSWRADGQFIAFAGASNGLSRIYVIRPDGTGLRAITKGPHDAMPVWSPRPFGLMRPQDVRQRTIVGRDIANVPKSDLQMLDMLATNNSSWVGYRDAFNVKPIVRYYKLLFVTQVRGHAKLATAREDGAGFQILETRIPGDVVSLSWERTASDIAFGVRNGAKSAIYVGEYPVTIDKKEDEAHPAFGIDTGQFVKSLRKAAVVPDVAPIAYTPNGEFVAGTAPKGVILYPVADSVRGSKPVSVPVPAGRAASFSWLPSGKLVSATAAGKIAVSGTSAAGALTDVENLSDFTDFDKGLRPLLEKNGFVAGGAASKQMYQIYEETDYSNLPIMITTDSLLHTNHLLFDYLLRTIEADRLMPLTVQLIDHYLKASTAQINSPKPSVAAAARANAAYFAVAARLALGDVATGVASVPKPDPNDPTAEDAAAFRAKQLAKQTALLDAWTKPLKTDLAGLPADVKAVADDELSLIRAHQAPAPSPLFTGRLDIAKAGEAGSDTRINYTDFIPRGHYTRGEILRRYFLVSRWFQNAPFRRTPELSRRALLILADTDPASRTAWDKIDNVVVQFIGAADDDNLASYNQLAKSIYGPSLSPDALEDDAKLNAFVEAANRLPLPAIAPVTGPSFRFFPPPYTADSEVLQKMAYNGPDTGVGTRDQPRYFALGLDVMSALGSERAAELLAAMRFQGSFFDFKLKETEYAKYGERMADLRKWLGTWKAEDWNRNLYTRTLSCFRPLLFPDKTNSNAFVRTDAWTDKQLNAALGTWAELKHDTLPKQPMVVEAGGEGGISETPLFDQPVGFVEPAPVVYERLLALVEAERAIISDPQIGTPDLVKRIDTFRNLLSMVQSLQKEQATGAPMTGREIEQMRFYGAYLEHLTLITADGQQGSMDNNDMAVVADVATAYSTRLSSTLALEEGVGRAVPIYVAVQRGGRRILTRGAIFTYYEFTQPADDRLTDEKWRAILDDPKAAPNVPTWTQTFLGRIDTGQ